VIAQIAMQVFNGPLGFLFPVFQIATLGILTLSAETSYSDFPRLTSLLARDKFLPSMFTLRGDRLAFTTGILVLALLAGLLLIVFKGSTDALINLFAVGVFLSFTLSQAARHRRDRCATTPGAQAASMIASLNQRNDGSSLPYHSLFDHYQQTLVC